MTSTTSAFIPAATRAGTAAYSPDTAASLSAAESSDTRSFEELCSEHDARGDADAADVHHENELGAEAAGEHRADQEPKPADEACDHDDDEETEEAERRAASVVLESPSIIQTLLASLRTTPAPGTAGSAENAGSTATGETPATSVRNDGRQASAGAEIAAATTAHAARQRGRATHAAEQTGASDSATGRRAAAPTATPGAGATPASGEVAAATPASVTAKSGNAAGDETAVQPAIARLIQAKGQAEKSAAQATAAQTAQNASGQNKFLVADEQFVATSSRSAGTRSAIPAATMSSSTHTAARHAESPVLATASSTTAGQGAWTETVSVDWKGWTNGGGERSSTAAQFSQLGDKLNHLGIAATPANATVARTATPAVQVAAPVAPTVPADAAEALAPIHSAIERLVLHGRDQLALTVRFEQGGSLSIKLAMSQGEIATQIQTDVPGLEAALKSAWGDLAQDWNSRGWKLGQPEFAASTPTYHQRDDSATADGRGAGRQGRQDADEAPDFGGRAFSPARLKHAGAVALSGLDALRAAALARRGIHTWA
ncbi:MAG: hypothetical protein IAE82_16595 [Opitutaceae bacterium]|nr:hypothetical protein [Opitutaceae bacterium]